MSWVYELLSELYEIPASPKRRGGFLLDHSDTVRSLFIMGSIVMLASFPATRHIITAPIFVSLFSIILLTLLIGFVSPRQKGTNFLNTLVALTGFLIFEYYAIIHFQHLFDYFFIINKVLATIFFVTLYYSIKTLRWPVPGLGKIS